MSGNGRQNTVLTPKALLVTIVLLGVAITTVVTVTRVFVITIMRLATTRTVHSGLYFICRLLYILIFNGAVNYFV